MNLWVRSQNKKYFLCNPSFVVNDDVIEDSENRVLGRYEDKRCLEIVDEIQKILMLPSEPLLLFKDCEGLNDTYGRLDKGAYAMPQCGNIEVLNKYTVVYEMPEK